MADSTEQLLEDILVAEVLILATQIAQERRASTPGAIVQGIEAEAIIRIKSQRSLILQLWRQPPQP